MNWRQAIATHGYSLFKGLTPPPLVVAAHEAIERDLAANYDSQRQVEYDNQSYCPNIVGSRQIMSLLRQSPVYSILDTLFGIDNLRIGKGQIAIRRAHNHPTAIPPTPHLDGFSTGANGVPSDTIYNHTALVGVFLSPIRTEFAGNFTVWPGSHYIYERYFRERGKRALTEPMPNPEIGEPVQLMCEPGDVVLAHYQLGHTAAVNTANLARVAVFFRVVLRTVDSDRWRYLTNIWEGWRSRPSQPAS